MRNRDDKEKGMREGREIKERKRERRGRNRERGTEKDRRGKKERERPVCGIIEQQNRI